MEIIAKELVIATTVGTISSSSSKLVTSKFRGDANLC